MLVIVKGRPIEIDWYIFKGANKQAEDFSQLDKGAIKMFLIGPSNKGDDQVSRFNRFTYEVNITQDANNKQYLQIDIDSEASARLDAGIYDIKVVWVKNSELHLGIREGNQHLSESRISGIFAITSDSEEDNTRLDSGVTAKKILRSFVEPTGYDGLSAYEIAVMHGYTDDEQTWSEEFTQAEARTDYEMDETKAGDGTTTRDDEKHIPVEEWVHESWAHKVEVTWQGNESTRQDNESTRQDNEDTRKTNEGIGTTDAECAAGSRRKNESIRVSNESTRQSQEGTRQDNETTRGQKETARQKAEGQLGDTDPDYATSRVKKELDRQSAEGTRISNEEGRVAAEGSVEGQTGRAYAESVRVSNESTRQSNEGSRGLAETARQKAEGQLGDTDPDYATSRIKQELDRQSAEAARELAETARENAKISSTTIEYAVGDSGTTAPISGWQSTIPSYTTGDFLWGRTTITFGDGTSKVLYAIGSVPDVSVSQNASTGKTTITVGSDSYDVATEPVSVSQNTETGKTELLIGDTAALIVDNEPEQNSNNLVKSGGVEKNVAYKDAYSISGSIAIDISSMQSNTALADDGGTTPATYHYTDLKFYPVYNGGHLNGKLRTLQSGGKYRPTICFYSDTNKESFVSLVRGNNDLTLDTDIPQSAKFFRFSTVNEPGINIQYVSPVAVQIQAVNSNCESVARLLQIGMLNGGAINTTSTPLKDNNNNLLFAFYIPTASGEYTNFKFNNTPIKVNENEVVILRNYVQGGTAVDNWVKEVLPAASKEYVYPKFTGGYDYSEIGTDALNTSVTPLVSETTFNTRPAYVYRITLQSDDIVGQTNIAAWIYNNGGSAISAQVDFGNGDLSKGISKDITIVSQSAYADCYVRFSTSGVASDKTLNVKIERKRRVAGLDEIITVAAEDGNYGSFDFYYASFGLNQEGARHRMCVAVGNNNMRNNTGEKNVTVGNDNMSDTTGSRNTSVGYHSLYRNTTGHDNAALGAESQDDNKSGAENTSLGAYSLQRNQTGGANVAIGAFALKGVDGGGSQGQAPDRFNAYNVAIGHEAMRGADHNCSYNVAIGCGAMKNNSDTINAIAIGYNVNADKNNQIKIGNTSHNEVVLCGNKKIVFNQDGTVTWEEVS